MKKISIGILFLFTSEFCFSQFELAGYFIEGNSKEMDSVLVAELINKFDIDTMGYEFIEFYGDFDKNLDLTKNYYGKSYSLNIVNGNKNFFKADFNEDKMHLNKYILINEHRFLNGRREINITIF